MKKILLFIFVVQMCTTNLLLAQKTWTGATSTAWATATNWSPSGVPTVADFVTIPIGTTNSPIITTAVSRTDNTTVIEGTLTIASGGSVTVNGDLVDFIVGEVNSTTTLGILNINAGGSLTLQGNSVMTIYGTINNAGTITNTLGDIFFFISGSTPRKIVCSGSGTLTNNNYIDGKGTYTGCTFVNAGKVGYPDQIDCLTFENGLTNTSTSTMEFTVNATPTTACTNYDRVTVTGNLTLAGTFSVTGSPPIGNYVVMTYTGTKTGAFTNSNFPIAGGKYANITVSGGNVTLGITNAMVLPVELVNFAANTEGSKTNLTWATASETNNKGFDIERSYDGTNFSTIGTVKAQGKAGTYTFVDAQPFNGINYYRLKQVDFDGTETLSKVVSVTTTGKGTSKIKIFPTNTEGSIFIESGQLTIDNVQVFNNVGQLVLSSAATSRLDLSAMPSGLYLVQVKAGGEVATEKVFKN